VMSDKSTLFLPVNPASGMGERARSVRAMAPWVPILASRGKAGVPILARPWRPKCQYWQGALRSGECLAKLTIAHSLAGTMAMGESFSPNGWGRFHQSADGVPVNPTQEANGRRPFAYRCGGPGAKPPGGCGVDGRGPIRAIIRLPPAGLHPVANRIGCSPDPDRVATGFGGHRRGAHHGHVANVSTTVNKCKQM
jgi:hypothetical protein